MSLYEFAKNIVLEAGQNIREKLNRELIIETKSNPNDLVTNMDKETEDRLVKAILAHDASHRIIGEEGHGKDVESLDGTIWVIDPIDGTMNFVHQQQNFAISVGIFVDGSPYAGIIYDVMNDDLYHALHGEGAYFNDIRLNMLSDRSIETSIISMNPNWLTKNLTRDIYSPVIVDSRSARSYGSAALDFAFLSRGIIDCYMTLRLHPWDFCGGMIIAEEVGAIVTNQLGEPLTPLYSNSVLAANPKLHHEILNGYLRPYYEKLAQVHQGMFKSR